MATKKDKAEASVLPAIVTLDTPYGYWSDEEVPQLKMWQAGQEVTDAAEIEDLIKREAPLKD